MLRHEHLFCSILELVKSKEMHFLLQFPVNLRLVMKAETYLDYSSII